MIRGESWVMRWKPAKLTRLLEAKADVGPKLTGISNPSHPNPCSLHYLYGTDLMHQPYSVHLRTGR